LARIRHLQNAPIVEAVVDVRVQTRPDFKAEEFLQVQETVRQTLPKVEQRRGVTLELAFGGQQVREPVTQTALEGFFFRSTDDKEVAQFRNDGFTFNRLAPYTSWQAILPRAMKLFSVYVETSRPIAISRVATRYINRLQLPSDRYAEYLTHSTRGVPGANGRISGFIESAVAVEDSGATVSFSQGLESSSDNRRLPEVLVDIDAFMATTCASDPMEVERRLELLHDLKNRVFFEAITEATAILFQ
jgi:uncharacterized protein (TIGR04255 family)